MSLLTDTDFLLRAFQLSYIRQVLPSHAPHSSRSGQGPYNPVKFPDPNHASSRSPYIALAGFSDEQQWPELASGRSSPPLALTLARDSSRTSHQERTSDIGGEAETGRNRRRRTAGPGSLGYTQTIVGKGSGVGGAGMRVDGVKRSWKGKGKLAEPGGLALEDENRGSTSRSRDPLDGDQPQFAPNLVPPPVVVHSPVRTPRDSPGGPYRSINPRATAHSMQSDPNLRSAEPSASAQDPNATITATRKPRFSTSANEYHLYPDFSQRNHPSSPPALVESPSNSLVEIAEDYPSQPNSMITDGSSAFRIGQSTATSPDSIPPPTAISPSPSPGSPPRVSAPPLSASSNRLYGTPPLEGTAPIAEDLASSDFPSGPLRDTERGGGIGGGMPVSMASSGISLFGTSRLERSTELTRSSLGGDDSSDQSEIERRRRRNADQGEGGGGGGGGGLARRPRADSDLSFSSDPAVAQRATLPPPPEPIATPNVPVFKLPPGMRVRERRRVNIKPGPGGALFVPTPVLAPIQNAVPLGAEEVLPMKQPSSPKPSTLEPDNKPGAASPPQRPPLSPSRSRKVSASLNTSNTTLSTNGEKLAPPSPGSRSPRKKDEPPSPILSFPKRSSYLRPNASPLLSPPNQAAPKSALTAILTSPSTSSLSDSNPFSTLYAACVSRSSLASEQITLTLFFPHCSKPGPSKPIKVKVKRDVTVEEVIGVGLWAYWEAQEKEAREPKLEVDEEKAETGEETTKWNLRIVEDDGEVDDDFPALDRIRAISAFSFSEFAIVRANDQQVQDNASKQATITRRPSRILSGPKRVSSGPVPISSALAPPPQGQLPTTTKFALPPAASNANAASFKPGNTTVEPVGASSAFAVSVSIKVELPPLGPGSERSTTVEVPSDMYLLDFLEQLCRKRNLGSSNDWAFIVRLSDGDIVVPLDRTVESLGDQRELVLVSRSQVGTVGLRQRRNTQNINPAASIFQRVEEPNTPRYQSASQQLTSTYQLYRVQRKLPMSLGGRHPRSIAIDGDYLHFMPADGKDSAGRTSSFHISLVQSCKVSRRSASSFKIVVHTKNRVDKRYDFEAESSAQANEIVESVRTVMTNWRNEQALTSGRRGIVGR